MYKNLTLINGVILAIMVFVNGMLASITGPYMSTLVYHLLGFSLIIFISIIKKNKLSNFKEVPAVYIVILSFISQMVTSAIIDYLYFHIFSKGKIIGGALFLIGLIINARADNKYKQEILS